MARRSRSPRGFIRPPKKTVMWIGSSIAGTTIPASSAVLFGVLNAAALALRPFTIMRARGFISWISDQATVTENGRAIFGQLVVTDSASAAGIASIPSPGAEASASWQVYQGLWQRHAVISEIGVQHDVGQGEVFQYDSKAMRKVGIDDDIAQVVENLDAVGGIASSVGRLLVQLH